MKQKQNNACAICKKLLTLCVDHNHKTGKVRGLLCRKCNSVLGFINDNQTIALQLVNYLEEYKNV